MSVACPCLASSIGSTVSSGAILDEIRVEQKRSREAQRSPGTPLADVPPFSPKLTKALRMSIASKSERLRRGLAAALLGPLEIRQLLIDAGLSPGVALGWQVSFEGAVHLRLTTSGERFYRYSNDPLGRGSFLTSEFFSNAPAAAVAFNLDPHFTSNHACFRQTVVALARNPVLEGTVHGELRREMDSIAGRELARHRRGHGAEPQTVIVGSPGDLGRWHFEPGVPMVSRAPEMKVAVAAPLQAQLAFG